MGINETISNKSILDQVASAYLKVDKATSGISNSTADKESAQYLADHKGGSAKARRVSVKLFPPGHDAEYNAARAVMTELDEKYLSMTAPYGMGVGKTKDGKTKAAGARIIKATDVAELIAFVDAHKPKLDLAREALAQALPAIENGIRNDPEWGPAFNAEKFPTAEKVREAFRWELIGPDAFADGRSLEGLPATNDWLGAVQSRMERDMLKQLEFTQQSIASELAGYVKNLAKNTKILVDWAETDPETRGRRPRIVSTLTTNVLDLANKAGRYAIVGTELGDKLLELRDRVIEELDVDRIEADDIKDNIPLARDLSNNAAKLAEVIENFTGEFGCPTF